MAALSLVLFMQHDLDGVVEEILTHSFAPLPLRTFPPLWERKNNFNTFVCLDSGICLVLFEVFERTKSKKKKRIKNVLKQCVRLI